MKQSRHQPETGDYDLPSGYDQVGLSSDVALSEPGPEGLSPRVAVDSVDEEHPLVAAALPHSHDAPVKPTIQNPARGLGTTVTEVIAASAASLGLDVHFGSEPRALVLGGAADLPDSA